jgi:hypothetical protein
MNGYWGNPAYKLPPEANLMAVTHYLEALDFQKEIVKIHTIYGGKNPHPNWLVGGVPCAINVHDTGAVGAINMERLNLVNSIIDRSIEFIEQVYIPDLLAIASASTRAGPTAAACRRRACCPTATSRSKANDYSPGNLHAAARRHHQRRPDKVHEVDLKRPEPDPGIRGPLLVQVRPAGQGPASLGRRHRAPLTSWARTPRAARPDRADRRRRQVLLDQGAALARPRHGSGPPVALVIGYVQKQARVQGAGRHGAEETGRAAVRAVLHPGPHRGARPEKLPGPPTRCATSRTS